MKFYFGSSFPYQIEILPRLTLRFDDGGLIVFEFLFWGIGLISKKWLETSETTEINDLLWDVKRLCNMIGNSTSRIITKEIEDIVQIILHYDEVNNVPMPEEIRNLMAKVQTTYCGDSLVGPSKK